MKGKIARTMSSPIVTFPILILAFASGAARPQQPAAPAPYPNMAPLEQYLMPDRSAEIALARSAAPRAISDDAEVMVLTRQGYETAAKGTNGFLCIVERGWTAPEDDPNFWNPKLRGPICFNAAAVRSYLPHTFMKTQLILAGKSKAEMFRAIESALDKKELPSPERDAMCYMLSKQQYLDDKAGHWHPHVMFFVPLAAAAAWGANLDGSPVMAADAPQDRMSIFMIPVPRWSDGTLDESPMN
ncbi:MAG: hypothetical protein ABSD70_17570 [Terracidiphilus sp.]|jgi:hypothetical protein